MVEKNKTNWLHIAGAIAIIVLGGVVIWNTTDIGFGKPQFDTWVENKQNGVIGITNTGAAKTNVSVILEDQYECRTIDRIGKNKTVFIDIHSCADQYNGVYYSGRITGLDYFTINWKNKSEEHEI